MYIKIYEKNDKTYYALYVYDKKQSLWASTLISYEIYNSIKEIVKVK